MASPSSSANKAISFVQSDVFENISGSFDIIVSNPPYISENDKNEVGINVLASEPKMALFADEEGLAIYRQIIEEADKYLTPSGKLYFEIGYKQGQDLKKLKCPVLALNGEKDIQVDAAMNLAAIQERITGNGNKNVTVKAYPNLNHLFQTCEKGTLAEYGQLEETISPEVLKDITDWILKHSGKSN